MRAVLVILALIWPSASWACSVPEMLTFIGGLEAPEGYDQVYSGMPEQPPRRLTRMRVWEVLEWQREMARVSVSTAVGQYQVIRPTLQSLVDQGVIDENEMFTRGLQDRIGQHLLIEAGYGNPSLTTEEQANRIANVWAALPRVSGSGHGQSAHEGVAGNRALTSAELYLAVMNCEITAAEALEAGELIRTVTLRLVNLDAFIEELANIVDELAPVVMAAALSLLVGLAVIDVALALGYAMVRGDDLPTVVASKSTKLVIVGMFAFLIMNGQALVSYVSEGAIVFLEIGTDGWTFSFGGLGREKMIAIMALIEWAQSVNIGVYIAMVVIAICLIVVAGLQFGILAYIFARSFIGVTIALFGLGLGGLDYTRAVAMRCAKAFIAAALAMTTALVCVMLTVELSRASRELGNGPLLATQLLMIEVIALVLLFALPRAAASLAR